MSADMYGVYLFLTSSSRRRKPDKCPFVTARTRVPLDITLVRRSRSAAPHPNRVSVSAAECPRRRDAPNIRCLRGSPLPPFIDTSFLCVLNGPVGRLGRLVCWRNTCDWLGESLLDRATVAFIFPVPSPSVSFWR